jgi:stage V sporulation protein G
MEITEVKIVLRNDDKLKAYATITLDDCFVVRRLRIIQSARGLFVAMPARRKPDGTYQDLAHPINATMRAKLETQVIAKYLQELQSVGGDVGVHARVLDGDDDEA